jgi:hypothetical protein
MYLVRRCTVPKALSYSVMGVVGLVIGYYLELPPILGNSIKFVSAIQILGGLVCATYQAAQPVEDAQAAIPLLLQAPVAVPIPPQFNFNFNFNFNIDIDNNNIHRTPCPDAGF